MKPTLGSTVLYTLSEDDVHDINDPLGVPYRDNGSHAPVQPGQTYPADVVVVDGSAANLRVLLDGYAIFRATSRVEGDTPGTWAPRVEA